MAEEVLRAKIVVDVKEAISAYTQARQAHVSMVTALNTGAGALVTTGAAIAGVGVGIAAGLVVAVNAAAEFERKLDFFSAVSDATVKDMEKVRAKALELGADTIYSADQVADAFVNLAKSGVDAQKILAGVGEAVVNLGAATDMPLEEAATSLTTVLNTFGIAAEDAVEVVDKLAGAANSSSIEVQDLILTLTYAGASAKIAGIEFDDVNTAIALLGERGIKGSKAGTGLRQMFDKLLAPTKAGSEALKELNVIAEDGTNRLIDLDGGLKPIPQLLDILNGSLANLTTSEKADVLGQIFPITSLPTILNLLDGGSAAMERLNGEISKTTALDIASERLDNLSGDVEILRGNFDTLLISIGATQQGLARGLVQAVNAVVTWLNKLNPAMLSALTMFAGISAAVLVLIGFFGIMSGAILQILALYLRIKDSLTFIIGIASKFGDLLARMWVVALGPIGTVIAVIAALVAILVLFFTKTEAGRQAWEQITEIFKSSLQSVLPLFKELGAAFSTLLSTLMPLLTQIVAIVAGVLIQALTALVPAFIVIAEAIAGTLVVALQFLLPLLTGLVEILTGPIGGAILAIVGVIAAVIAVIKIWTAVQWALNIAMSVNPIIFIITAILALVAAIIWVATQTTFFQDLWANLASFFTTVWTAVAGFFMTLWTNISNFFIGVWTSIVSFLSPILAVIGAIFKFWFEAIGNIILIFLAVCKVVWDAIVLIFVAAWSAIVAFVTPIVEYISSIITIALNTIQGIWETVWGAISSFFGTIWNAIIAYLAPIIARIQSIINIALNTIRGVWNSIWGAISSFFQSIWNNFVGHVQGPVSKIFGIISSIQGTIMGILSGAANWLYSIGKNIIQGLINGITSMFSNIVKAVSGVVNGAIDWAKKTLGIKSPSTVFRAIGIDTIMGMVLGVERTAPQLERTMETVASGLDAFYDQVYAAREMDVMMNLQSQMGVDAYSATQANQLALMNEQLQAIAEKDTFNVEQLTVENAVPESASESLPNAIRKTVHVLG